MVVGSCGRRPVRSSANRRAVAASNCRSCSRRAVRMAGKRRAWKRRTVRVAGCARPRRRSITSSRPTCLRASSSRPNRSAAQEDPPLSPRSERKDDVRALGRGLGPNRTFVPVVSAHNDTAKSEFGGDLEFLDASSDLAHVVFESTVGLTAEDPLTPGLYEWDAESQALQLVSVLPDGSPAPDESSAPVSLGDGGGLNDRGAISSDGSRVFWTDGGEEGLYLRDTARGETIKLNAAQGNGATAPGRGWADVVRTGSRTSGRAFPGRQPAGVGRVLHRHRAPERRIGAGTGRRRSRGRPVRVSGHQR